MTVRTPEWIMTVPVLNTEHLPSADPFDDEWFVAITRDGFFVYCGDDPQDWEDAPWFQKILEWVQSKPLDRDVEWVRFDPDGDLIEGLPRYEW